MQLTPEEQALLAGDAGEGVAMAMRLVVGLGTALAAPRLIPITRAHIDGCLYTGRAGIEFAERLVDGGAEVRVPATLNVSSLDLLHPELYRGDEQTERDAQRLMAAYEALGCRPTWTCAPYQLSDRPVFGEHIAWAESNAIVFANSVLGARTNRYGDFIDVAAAIVGRVPEAGLHTDEGRRGRVLFDVTNLPAELLGRDVFFPVLGLFIGRETGHGVPVVVGIDAADEDQLKALGAAAATAGSVGLVHVVGITPEAPDVATATGGQPIRTVSVTETNLRQTRERLTAGLGGGLGAVSVGTPHYSLAQIESLVDMLAGRRVTVPLYMSTGRDTLAAAAERGLVSALEAAGVQPVVDTCTYITPIIDGRSGVVMTDSVKWAYYAPGNLGLDPVYGSSRACVESAVSGSIHFDDHLWHD